MVAANTHFKDPANVSEVGPVTMKARGSSGNTSNHAAPTAASRSVAASAAALVRLCLELSAPIECIVSLVEVHLALVVDAAVSVVVIKSEQRDDLLLFEDV